MRRWSRRASERAALRPSRMRRTDARSGHVHDRLPVPPRGRGGPLGGLGVPVRRDRSVRREVGPSLVRVPGRAVLEGDPGALPGERRALARRDAVGVRCPDRCRRTRSVRSSTWTTGVRWVGSAFLFVASIGPSAAEVGPSAGPVDDRRRQDAEGREGRRRPRGRERARPDGPCGSGTWTRSARWATGSHRASGSGSRSAASWRRPRSSWDTLGDVPFIVDAEWSTRGRRGSPRSSVRGSTSR